MEGEPSQEKLDFETNMRAIKRLIEDGLPEKDAKRYIQLIASGRYTKLSESEQKEKDRITDAIRELGIDPEQES